MVYYLKLKTMAYRGKEISLTGLFYQYISDTTPPVNKGDILFNNANVGLATLCYISVIDAEDDNNEQLLIDWPDVGTSLTLMDTTDSSIYVQFEIISVTLYAGQYLEWGIAVTKASPTDFHNHRKTYISTSVIGLQNPIVVRSGSIKVSKTLEALLAGKIGTVLVVNATENGFNLIPYEESFAELIYVEADLSPQPTQAELDIAFSAPTENMEGYVLDVTHLPRLYHVIYVEGEYFYERMTKAS